VRGILAFLLRYGFGTYLLNQVSLWLRRRASSLGERIPRTYFKVNHLCCKYHLFNIDLYSPPLPSNLYVHVSILHLECDFIDLSKLELLD